MRRDAKAMVAYLAELKGAFDSCAPVGRSLAEVSRGEPLLNSAGRAALLAGRLERRPSCPRQELRACRYDREETSALGAMGSRFHRQRRGRQSYQPSLSQVLNLLHLGCISKMRRTNRPARLTGPVGALALPGTKPSSQNAASGTNPKRMLPGSSSRSSNGCVGPALLPGGAVAMPAGIRPDA